MVNPPQTGLGSPPAQTRNVLGDVGAFLLHRPAIPTLIRFTTQKDRENYSHRIMQRVGIDVTDYAVLNLHQIGVEAPVRLVFEEALSWSGDSSCWPNHLAEAERVNGLLERIMIRPLGISKLPFGPGARFGWRVRPLFEMNIQRIQHSPGASGPDNARYFLHSCSGGYPIGVFLFYLRSSIASQGESERCQVFLCVGFNFYGRKTSARLGPLAAVWESVHNRVTANVLNRFKQLCEWRFARTQAGLGGR